MSAEWFYTQSGQQLGPVTSHELKQLAQSGRLQPTDLVWKDGMANWTTASSTRGLFAGAGSDAQSAPTRAESSFSEEPYGQPSRHTSHDGGWDEPRSPRRSKKPQASNQGLFYGLLGGGIALVFIVGLIVFLVVRSNRTKAAAQAKNNTPATKTAKTTPKIGPQNNPNINRTFTLGVGRSANYYVTFQRGQTVEITVTSNRNSDVDLFVYDKFGTRVAGDEDLSKDCKVTFTAAMTQSYKISVVNRKHLQNVHRNMSNSGTVVWTTNVRKPKAIALQVPSTVQGALVAGETLVDRPGSYYQVYTVFLQARRNYTIDMTSTFDTYLFLKNSRGFSVARDDDGGSGLNARIFYQPAQSGVYTIYATSFTRAVGAFTLSIR